MAAISDSDVSINAAGDIRWTGAATANRHSVLEFIQFLQDKQDDEQAAGNILLDITVDTPFDRSTNQIVHLNFPFNIDDAFAKHLYDGSVSQAINATNAVDTLYAGLRVIGPVEAGTEYMILQDGKILPAFWGTGINPEPAPSLVFSRHLVKVRENGADIDGKRAIVLARELGDQFRRFPVTFGTGNAVAAIGNGADIFNTKSDAVLSGYDSIVNTEGFQELNIDGDGAAGQEFYSQWDTGVQVINDVYERGKWITQRSHVADSNAETGNDFVVDDATTQGQASEFSATADGEVLTTARLRLKIGAGNLEDFTGTLYCELYDSDDAATAEPTGAALARSEHVLASEITSSYEDVLFQFNRLNPDTGADQLSGLTLTANQEYFIAVYHPDGTATEYFHVEGDTSTGDDGNQASYNGTVWSGVGTSALNFTVRTSPEIHGIPGDRFEGISTEVGYDGETGAGVVENEVCFWGTKVFYDTLAGSFIEGEHVRITRAGAVVSGGKLLHDDGGDELVIALENPAAAVIQDNDIITGIDSGATCNIDTGGGAIEDEDLSGGEGLILAKDDNGAAGEIYLQIVSGVNPVDNNRIRSATSPLANYVDATATINAKTISPEYLGVSTGSNIIGAYGIGFDANDVGSQDRFTSLDDASRVPPNNQTFTVNGLVSAEDRVLVGPRTGTSLDRGQFLLNTALTGGAETAIVVKDGTESVTPIADDIPDDGATANTRLRVQLDTGIYRIQAYTSITRASNQFNIASSDYSGANQAAVDQNVFVGFVDVLCDAAQESYTAEFVSARDLFVRVRDGGGTPTKTFENTGAQFLGTPQTVTAQRISDA